MEIVEADWLAKKIKRQCQICNQLKPKYDIPVVDNLSPERLVLYTPPFFITSCNYFEPLQVKVGRKQTKNIMVSYLHA